MSLLENGDIMSARRIKNLKFNILKSKLQLVYFYKTEDGKYKGIYQDKKGKQYTHVLTAEEVKEYKEYERRLKDFNESNSRR